MLLFCMDYESLEIFHGLSTWRGASLNFQMNYRSLKGFTQMTYIIIFYRGGSSLDCFVLMFFEF